MSQVPPFRVRPASADDAEALSRLVIGAFSIYEGRLDPRPTALKDTPDVVRARFPGYGGAIAEDDGRGIGCVLFTLEQNAILYLSRLAVDAGWRRRGIGRALIAYTEAEARRRGCVRMYLKVRIPLVDNQRLFKSCGFVEVSREAHPGYPEPTSIRMEKRL